MPCTLDKCRLCHSTDAPCSKAPSAHLRGVHADHKHTKLAITKTTTTNNNTIQLDNNQTTRETIKIARVPAACRRESSAVTSRCGCLATSVRSPGGMSILQPRASGLQRTTQGNSIRTTKRLLRVNNKQLNECEEPRPWLSRLRRLVSGSKKSRARYHSTYSLDAEGSPTVRRLF